MAKKAAATAAVATGSEPALEETPVTLDDEVESEGVETVPEMTPPPDPEIARVKEALAPSPTPAAIEPAVPTRSQRRASGATLYVVDPTGQSGELHRNGRIYLPGDTVSLDEATARALGSLVQPKKTNDEE